jgi:hypothetical protein
VPRSTIDAGAPGTPYTPLLALALELERAPAGEEARLLLFRAGVNRVVRGSGVGTGAEPRSAALRFRRLSVV